MTLQMALRMAIGGLSATLVFEFCTRLRAFFEVAYVPIYFQFLPLEVLNRDLSIYLGDDYFLGDGEGPKLTRVESRRLKTRIQLRGALAVAVSAIAIPGVTAFAVAHYMPPESLWPAVIGIGLLQAFRIRLAMRDFGIHASLADSGTKRALAFVYVIYTAATLWVFHTVYIWTHTHVVAGSYKSMIGDILRIFVGQVVVSGIVMALVAAVFLKFLTERHVPALDEHAENADEN